MTRKGVAVVLFDLHFDEKRQRREYAAFHKSIRNAGYVMLQRSVYVKLLRNVSSFGNEVRFLDGISPRSGDVKVLRLSLETFSDMVSLRGCDFDVSFFADDMVCI